MQAGWHESVQSKLCLLHHPKTFRVVVGRSISGGGPLGNLHQGISRTWNKAAASGQGSAPSVLFSWEVCQEIMALTALRVFLWVASWDGQWSWHILEFQFLHSQMCDSGLFPQLESEILWGLNEMVYMKHWPQSPKCRRQAGGGSLVLMLSEAHPGTCCGYPVNVTSEWLIFNSLPSFTTKCVSGNHYME